jgi:hypothetical protein
LRQPLPEEVEESLETLLPFFHDRPQKKKKKLPLGENKPKNKLQTTNQKK